VSPLPDVLVVGGGLIGCACAHSLAKRGLRVLVLEREDLAAGAWTAPICAEIGVPLPVQPRRGEILVTEPMPPMLSSIILHAPYVAAKLHDGDERAATLVLEQIEEGNVLIGSTRAYAGFDARSTPQGILAIAREARRLAPGLADLSVIRSFSGLRPASPDGLPLLGPLPGFDGLYVATGHEGDGIALAPITGEIVGASLVGGDATWPADLLPARRTSALARLTSEVHAARAGD
jgi:glycine/D-amino acid oxidase-like deaminating enzyme